jgi:hypothetical protein
MRILASTHHDKNLNILLFAIFVFKKDINNENKLYCGSTLLEKVAIKKSAFEYLHIAILL